MPAQFAEGCVLSDARPIGWQVLRSAHVHTDDDQRIRFEVACAQLQGGRKRQEDAYATRCVDESWLAFVADGLGGHAKGDEAADVAVHMAIESMLRSKQAQVFDWNRALHRAFMAAHRAILKNVKEDHLSRPASTLIGGWFDARRRAAHLASIGDSLAYRLRDGQVECLFGEPRFGSSVGRCLGYDVGSSDGDGIMVLGPPLALRAGDRILLCTDGIKAVSSPAYLRAVLSEGDARKSCEQLTRALIESGAREQDNVTIVIVDVTSMLPASAVSKEGNA